MSHIVFNKFRVTNSSPTSIQDSSQGYDLGSSWINTSSDTAYICVDTTISGAIWKDFSSGMSDITASGTIFNPVGAIVATDVQAAIEELDSEKVSITGDTMTGDLSMSGNNIVSINSIGLGDVTSPNPNFVVDGQRTTGDWDLSFQSSGGTGYGGLFWRFPGQSTWKGMWTEANDERLYIQCDSGGYQVQFAGAQVDADYVYHRHQGGGGDTTALYEYTNLNGYPRYYFNPANNTIDTDYRALFVLDESSISLPSDSFAENVLLDITHYMLDIDATVASRSVAFTSRSTAAVSEGRIYVIRKSDSTSNTVTVSGTGSDTINGVSTYTITQPKESITIQSDGVNNWNVIGKYDPDTDIDHVGTYVAKSGDTMTGNLIVSPPTGNAEISAESADGYAQLKLTGGGTAGSSWIWMSNNDTSMYIEPDTDANLSLSTYGIGDINITANDTGNINLNNDQGAALIVPAQRGDFLDEAVIIANGANPPTASLNTGTFSANIKNATSNQTQYDRVNTFFFDTSGGSRTLGLRFASEAAQRFVYVKKTDSSTNTVTINPYAGETIEGSTSYVLSDQNQSVILQHNGVTDWKVLATHDVTDYVNSTGDTMTGDLIISSPGDSYIHLEIPDGSVNGNVGYTLKNEARPKWEIYQGNAWNYLGIYSYEGDVEAVFESHNAAGVWLGLGTAGQPTAALDVGGNTKLDGELNLVSNVINDCSGFKSSSGGIELNIDIPSTGGNWGGFDFSEDGGSPDWQVGYNSSSYGSNEDPNAFWFYDTTYRLFLERQGAVSMTGVSLPVSTKIASYTVLKTDNLIRVDDDSASGDVTITLPTVVDAWNTVMSTGLVITVKKLGTTYDVIISGNGAELLDGVNTHTIGKTNQYSSLTFQCNGTSWDII